MNDEDQGIQLKKNRAVMEGGEQVVKTSRRQVEALKRETAGYGQELKLDEQGVFQKNAELASQIATLQRVGDKYKTKIEKQEKRLKELEAEIKEMQSKIAQQRVELKRSEQKKESNEELHRKIKTLENKLDKQLQKYNQAIGQNKQLRAQIDSVRRERVVFDNIYKKLEGELNEKKKTMVRIIEQAETAYHAREAAKSEMLQLKKSSEQQQKQFDEEWAKLNQLIEHDKQKKELLRRDQQHALSALHALAVPKKAPQTRVLEELEQQEKAVKQRVSATSWNTAKDAITIEKTLAKVEQYEEAFRSIKQATGLSRLEDIVQLFVHAEEQNFSLFNYVNELTAQIEGLETQINGTKAEILKYQHTGYIGKGDDEQMRIHQQLQKRLAVAEKEAALYDKQYEETQQTMAQLKAGVHSIFQKIGCQPDGYPELASAEVNQCNIATYLGIIEKRATQILAMYQSGENKSGLDESSSVAQTQLPPLPKRLDPPIEIRRLDEEEAGSIPLSEKDLKEKALHYFAQKYQQGDLTFSSIDRIKP